MLCGSLRIEQDFLRVEEFQFLRPGLSTSATTSPAIHQISALPTTSPSAIQSLHPYSTFTYSASRSEFSLAVMPQIHSSLAGYSHSSASAAPFPCHALGRTRCLSRRDLSHVVSLILTE